AHNVAWYYKCVSTNSAPCCSGESGSLGYLPGEKVALPYYPTWWSEYVGTNAVALYYCLSSGFVGSGLPMVCSPRYGVPTAYTEGNQLLMTNFVLHLEYSN